MIDNHYNKYWTNDMSKNYYNNFKWTDAFVYQEDTFRKYIRNSLHNIENVLELGAGFGRITKIIQEELKPISHFAVEISPDQINHSMHYLGSYLFNKIWWINSNVLELGFEPNQYDLVIASEFLLHVLPKDIPKLINSMVNASKKHIMNIDWAYGSGPGANSTWCFLHDYLSLYKQTGQARLETQIELKRIGQAIFHYKKVHVNGE